MHTGTLLTAAFHSQEHEQRYRDASGVQVAVFGTARSPHFSLAIISVTVQLWKHSPEVWHIPPRTPCIYTLY
jgi:hypothetical protein